MTELTNAQKAARLEMAVAMLHDVDAMQQAAIGASDVCYDNHCRIQDLIEDLEADIEELKALTE